WAFPGSLRTRRFDSGHQEQVLAESSRFFGLGPARPDTRLIEGGVLVFGPHEHQVGPWFALLRRRVAFGEQPGLAFRRSVVAREEFAEKAHDPLARAYGSGRGRTKAMPHRDLRTGHITDPLPVTAALLRTA